MRERSDGLWRSRMIAFALALQAAAVDSGYASPALRQFVAASTASNREPRPTLASYRARLESEIAVVLGLTPQGGVANENAVQVEQIESDMRWARSGAVEQHVIGYRAHTVTTSVSALSYLRRPWVIPSLYGDRLHLLFERDAIPLGGRGDTTFVAVHPFGVDRDAYYRFAGGDTIARLRLTGRVLPIVRVLVEPRGTPPERTLLFRGEVDVDASRHQIVRLRGEFVVAGGRRSVRQRVLGVGLRTFAFAELVEGEFDGRYWLPTYQRIEAQGRSKLAAGFRPVFRVVTRFRGYTINDDSLQLPSPRASDERLTFAPRDSVSRFGDWTEEIGAATVEARAADFDDVAPDQWRSTGGRRIDWRAERVSDVFRFNRVEGPYTGAAATLRFRDEAPGLSVGGYGGWAWTEQTARGGVNAQWLRRPWQLGLRAERALANTNDFRPVLDYEASLAALLVTADDYDYVDRRRITASAAREIGGTRGLVLRAELGPGSDRAERARVRYGAIHLHSAFRANRPVAEGRYVRTALAAEVHPYVSGEFLEPGVGGALWYERGDGMLHWQRVEGRVVARHTRGPWTYATRVDGAAVFGGPAPPQQLLEFGENEGLPGYAYQEFGGDRAALARGTVYFALPVLRSPLRVWRGITLPSLSPSFSFGTHAGWATASSPSTRATLATFGFRTDRVTGEHLLTTRPTDGVRSTVDLALRVLGNALGVGIARPIDHRAPWRFVLSIGQGP